jgi:hypothetical protein
MALTACSSGQKKWKVNISQIKSAHITFTVRNTTCPTVLMYGVGLPRVNEVKYLGMHLDGRIAWSKHIETKRKQPYLKFSKMCWLLGRQSNVSSENKLILYKTVLQPIWTYGIQLWGTASKSSTEILQIFQSKTLSTILNVPWHINNSMIHKDLQTKTVKEVISEKSARYTNELNVHLNHLAVNLLEKRRRKQTKAMP